MELAKSKSCVFIRKMATENLKLEYPGKCCCRVRLFCDPVGSPGDFPGKNPEVGCLLLLQGFYQTQKSNLWHCGRRWFFTIELPQKPNIQAQSHRAFNLKSPCVTYDVSFSAPVYFFIAKKKKASCNIYYFPRLPSQNATGGVG